MRNESLFETPREDYGESGGFDVHEYLELLRRRWKLIAACALIGIVIGVIHYQITPRLYKATSTIQIERKRISPSPTNVNVWMENWWNMEFYPTQHKLIQSRGMAERVVQNLRLYEDSFFSPQGVRAQASGEDNTSAFDDQTALAGMGQRLKGGLTVEPVKSTQLVQLSYRSLDPEFAARVANGYADTYIDWGIAERSSTAEMGTVFLASEIETLKQEIRDKEAELKALTLNSDAIVTDAQGSSMVDSQIESLNQSYSQAVRDRVEKEARYRELLSQPKESVANVQSGGLVAQLRSAQVDLEQDYETRLETYKPEWPAMVELKTKIEQGRARLDSVIDDNFDKARQSGNAEYQAAQRQEESLRGEMSRLRGQALGQSVEAVEMADLQAEIQTRRDNLESFYQAQADNEAAARFQQTRQSNIRIVDRALVPRGPFQPNLKTDLVLGAGLGLAGGILLVFLFHYLDRTVKTGDQAEKLLGLPVLAVIADVSGARRGNYGYYGYAKRRPSRSGAKLSEKESGASPEIELMPDHHPRMATSEAYRSLRAALLMSTASELQVVSLTSTESSEGKSVTASNLAIVMAQLGKRVLLVDADLRRSRLHKIFGVSNRGGLVSCLTGGVALGAAATPSEISDLDLLPSGPIPPNPSELLASSRMAELVAQMREAYDFVILDSPPVLAVSDPMHIGSVADGVVFCIAADSTHKDHCLAARDRLVLAGVKLLGLVLNRYDAGDKGSRKRYYYHYQQYYAQEEEAEEATGSAA